MAGDETMLLDVGCGEGEQAYHFAESGIKVTGIDIKIPEIEHKNISFLPGSWESFDFREEFDIIWCSHILEHQLNVNEFLLWVKKTVKDGGVIAITVPPAKHIVVSGHFTIWNAGLVLYNLVMAGLNCKDAQIKEYTYNITVIIKKEEIELPDLYYNRGDLTNLKDFFPNVYINLDGFFGNFKQLNWG
jgi:2-polyprenyl-3-methyl-5-hydroxy-6-metoxy-1,4-benzoquinol methylase